MQIPSARRYPSFQFCVWSCPKRTTHNCICIKKQLQPAVTKTPTPETKKEKKRRKQMAHKKEGKKKRRGRKWRTLTQVEQKEKRIMIYLFITPPPTGVVSELRVAKPLRNPSRLSGDLSVSTSDLWAPLARRLSPPLTARNT